MKRLLVAILALLYLAAGAGFTLREHYCMGEHVGSALEHPAQQSDSHRCDRCGMEKKSGDNGCCKDEVKVLKASPDQTVVSAFTFSAAMTADLPPAAPAFGEQPVLFSARDIHTVPAHGPPLRSGPPLYLRVRCIRI